MYAEGIWALSSFGKDREYNEEIIRACRLPGGHCQACSSSLGRRSLLSSKGVRLGYDVVQRFGCESLHTVKRSTRATIVIESEGGCSLYYRYGGFPPSFDGSL